MKLAVMQPYFLPYLGYFQLMKAVDLFVFYDDVSYINRGWINRNRLLVHEQPWMFTVPLANASQNVLIKDLVVSDAASNWRKKLKQTIQRNYSKAPHYAATENVITSCLDCESKWFLDWLLHSSSRVCDYLGIRTPTVQSSARYSPSGSRGQDRILDICKHEGADTYINAINGRALYSPETFEDNNINLHFLSPNYAYRQFSDIFVPHLSIVDVLMFNSQAEVRRLLNDYELV